MHAKARAAVAALGLLVAAAAPAAAQGVELGADLGLGYNFDAEVFDITAPTTLRVGFPVGDALTLEPRTTLAYASGGGSSLFSWAVQGAVLYPLGGDREEGVYLVGLPGIEFTSFEEDFLGIDVSDTQFSLGAGLGVRIPQGDRFGLRFEAQLVHGFETDLLGSSTALRGSFGMSFRTR